MNSFGSVIIAYSMRSSFFLADHDFYLNFPTRQASQFSKVTTTGDKAVKAFTICAWLKTSDLNYMGILRYSGDGFSDRISLSIKPDQSNRLLVFTLFDEDRYITNTNLFL